MRRLRIPLLRNSKAVFYTVSAMIITLLVIITLLASVLVPQLVSF